MSIQTADFERAAEAVPSHPAVHDARLVDRRDFDGRRVLELVLLPDVDRIPPGVLQILADHDCGVGPTQEQGDFLIAEVR